MKYRFMGTPDCRFRKLKKRRIYDLEVKIENSGGFTGWLFGRTRPVIVEPFYCPYSSWNTFRQNWKPVYK